MTPFGTTSDGHTVHRVDLAAGDLRVSLLDLGAILQDVRFGDVPYSLTLGSDEVADYEDGMRYHGAIVGPVANRFTGAVAPIGGAPHRFEANDGDKHHLHGGAVGVHQKIWTVVENGADHVTFQVGLPDGEGNYPGNRRLTARFSIEAPATLRMEIEAATDRLTLINLANHSYWNLDGTECWEGHRLRVDADQYLPTTDEDVPTGRIAAVENTGMDFRKKRKPEVQKPPLDHNFCLSTARTDLREVLRLVGGSGIAMTIATTEPGIQVYDGRIAKRPGHDVYEGFAIEAQYWPDAPNHAGFPSIELAPGAPWRQVTTWTFSR